MLGVGCSRAGESKYRCRCVMEEWSTFPRKISGCAKGSVQPPRGEGQTFRGWNARSTRMPITVHIDKGYICTLYATVKMSNLASTPLSNDILRTLSPPRFSTINMVDSEPLELYRLAGLILHQCHRTKSHATDILKTPHAVQIAH